MYKQAVFLFLLLTLAGLVQAQQKEPVYHLSGAVTVTSKGISFIPSFTLGRPAVIFDISAGGQKFSFEPQLRFALDTKPWSMIFWWRYKLITHTKFTFSAGAHPALSYKTVTATINGQTKSITEADRYMAGELVPQYKTGKNSRLGLYYLYSHGFDAGAVRNTHFLTVNMNFSRIGLGKKTFLRAVPQMYYLSSGGKDGYYITSTLAIARDQLPFSISALWNKAIQTRISTSRKALWNINLSWSFNHQYGSRH